MGFLKNLFGGSGSNEEIEMDGMDHGVVSLILQCTHLVLIETQENMSDSQRQKFPWTATKQQRFLEQFYGERFVFDGEVKSMNIGWFFVDRELNGYVVAGLYAQNIDGVTSYEREWGESPPLIGSINLEFRNGKPCVRVKKLGAPPGTPNQWANQNWKDNLEDLASRYR